MKTDRTKILDDFLTGKLTGRERMDFEKELETNAGLRNELQLERDLNNVIINEDVDLFREKLIAVRNGMDKKQLDGSPVKSNGNGIGSVKKRNLFSIGTKQTWFLVAASIVVMAAIFSFLFHFTNKSYTDRELYAMYYEPYQSDIVDRSNNELDNSLLLTGIDAYNKGDYLKSSDLFNAVLIEEPENMVARFYGGISNLQNDETQEAIAGFQYIINNNGFLFVEQARWYLALTLLKSDTDQQDKALELLKELRDNNGDRSEDAVGLIEKIE